MAEGMNSQNRALFQHRREILIKICHHHHRRNLRMKALTHCTILYTRDAAHYPAFRDRIADLGGTALHLPLMATRTRSLSAAERTTLDRSDILVFTSAAAACHLQEQYPLRGQQTVAIGKATAAALPQPPNITAPAPYNSEALLAHWQPHGARIALIAAPGGRPYLAEILSQNNTVYTLYSYSRYNPSARWPEALPLPDTITIASQQTLDNLLAIIPQEKRKLIQYRACIAALSARVAQYAEKQGFQHIIAAENASETRQIAAICHWWKQTQEQRHD